MLEWAPGLVLAGAGEVGLGIVAHDAAPGFDQDPCMEATELVSLPLDLGKAEKPMPSRWASLKCGAVTALGISHSKKLSISRWSGIHQRGKKVVSASSGKTTSRQLCSARQ